MIRNVSLAMITLMGTIMLFSCQREEVAVAVPQEQISDETLSKIRHLGFSTTNVQRIPEGYLVEGDIVLTEENLNNVPAHQLLLRVGTEEQYRTNNLVAVSGEFRRIRISISSDLPVSYVEALKVAIWRYNSLGLKLKFLLVSSRPTISITKAPENANYAGSAGFPTNGNPFNSIKINPNYEANPTKGYLATVLAHEIGHCIGFRHTDYADRRYSCGGSFFNEGASTVGAVNIPGTPTGPDPNSWMLACIDSPINRPFNANDRVALQFLY